MKANLRMDVARDTGWGPDDPSGLASSFEPKTASCLFPCHSGPGRVIPKPIACGGGCDAVEDDSQTGGQSIGQK